MSHAPKWPLPLHAMVAECSLLTCTFQRLLHQLRVFFLRPRRKLASAIDRGGIGSKVCFGNLASWYGAANIKSTKINIYV